MADPDETRRVTDANRAAWEQVAPIHARHEMARLLEAFARPGHSCLDARETAVLQGIGLAGKDVAQVCCNNGRELISVRNLGAGRCVGFDGAAGFIDQARQLAEAAGQEIEFVHTDIYDIPASYRASFDLVTITIGVLSWMPDLPRFFKIVAGLLRPGGRLIIYEQHPITEMFEVGAAGDPVTFELSYFSREPFVDEDGLDYYGGEDYAARPTTSFMHRMSDVIMAGIGHGLEVAHFEELPDHISNTWYNVEAAGIGVPMSYVLVFAKPD